MTPNDDSDVDGVVDLKLEGEDKRKKDKSHHDKKHDDTITSC